MAGVYRSMIAENGKPVIGNNRDMLGVREGRNIDIPVRDNGTVDPGTGGLSVAPDWRRQPPHTIPRRLRPLASKARGNNRLSCFRLGTVEFGNTEINESLVLRPSSADHGTIEPKETVQIAEFQIALARTRDSWVIDEN
jgi:hypothetical protein